MADQSLTEVILKELAGLPESQPADVLAFVRFLKIGLAEAATSSQQFDLAISQARKIADRENISEEDIDQEIRDYRIKP